MPKITDIKIQKSDKTRANLYLDGEFAFGVEMVTIMKLGLKIGSDVTEEKLREAVFDNDKSVAFGKAADYLARGMKTSKQVRDYLVKKGYDDAVVGYVVEKLIDYRYLDDCAYARAYVEQKGRNTGSRRLKQELMEKGVNRELAEEYSDIPEEQSREAAMNLARKYMRNKPCETKTLQNLQRYLLGRGYGFDEVNSVVKEVGKEKLED